jgi:hypothetical protein
LKSVKWFKINTKNAVTKGLNQEMNNKIKIDFMAGIAGAFKPLMILLVGLFFVGKSIKKDYDRFRQSYEQVSIAAVDSVTVDEFELTGFRIKEGQLYGEKSGGIDLFNSDKDTESKVTVITKDIDHLLEDYNSKNKIIVKKFEGVHQGTPSAVKEYITAYGVNNSEGKPTTILIYEEYFRWKSVLGIYALCAIGILFIIFILLAKIRAY